MKSNLKNIMISLFEGLKKGYMTPTLPENILKFQSYPIIRVLRFLGGVSFILLLGNNYFNNSIFILSFSLFFASLFTVYHLVISYYRIKYMNKVLI